MDGMWSGQTLRERLPDLVTPFDARRVEQAAYALAVGPQVVVTGTSPTVRRDLAEREVFEVPPGQFAYILTEEAVALPNDVLGLLSMKFGEKIRGLINVSGFHVDPGYRGRLLFAVYNAGPQPVMLTRGAPTFLIWITPLDQTTDEPYTSTDEGRTEITATDIMKIQGEVFTPQALARRVDELEDRVNRFSGLVNAFVRIVAGVLITVAVSGLAVYTWQQVIDALSDDDNRKQEEPQPSPDTVADTTGG